MRAWWDNIDWATTWAGAQSIIALAALWFVVVQVTRDARLRRRRDLGSIVAVNTAVQGAILILKTWESATQKANASFAKSAGLVLDQGMLAALHTELEKVPLGDMPDEVAVQDLMGARATVANALKRLEQIARGGHAGRFPETS